MADAPRCNLFPECVSDCTQEHDLWKPPVASSGGTPTLEERPFEEWVDVLWMQAMHYSRYGDEDARQWMQQAKDALLAAHTDACEALHKYGQHTLKCALEEQLCICGFDEALLAARSATGATPEGE